jgi:hypothetical protein
MMVAFFSSENEMCRIQAEGEDTGSLLDVWESELGYIVNAVQYFLDLFAVST